MDLTTIGEQIREYVGTMSGNSQQYVSERGIAEKFFLNRSNSRKLLMGLEGEGLLQCVPQKGYRFIDYSNTSNRTLYTVRRTIESEAVRLAAEQAIREDILRMMLILDEAAAVVTKKDYRKFPRLDDDFHRALVNASHDNMLIKIFSFIFIPIFRNEPWPEGSLVKAHEEHKAILDAVRNHDPAESVKALLWHIGEAHNNEKVKLKP